MKRLIEEEKKSDVKNDSYEIIKLILNIFGGKTILTGRVALFNSVYSEPIIFCLLRAVEDLYVQIEEEKQESPARISNKRPSDRYLNQLIELISILSNDETQLSEKNCNGDNPIHYFASLG